jgi:hypothetical protein
VNAQVKIATTTTRTPVAQAADGDRSTAPLREFLQAAQRQQPVIVNHQQRAAKNLLNSLAKRKVGATALVC